MTDLKTSSAFASFAVRDAKKARAFYADTLGLKVNDIPDMDGMFEITASNDSKVMVYEKGEKHEPANFTVLNIPVENIENAMTDLKNKGVKFEVYNDPQMKTDANGLMRDPQHGMAIAWFKDPAGNVVSILEEPKKAA